MILIGDVREKLKELANESVNCVITSPPYWGLRDYGTANWHGGDNDCDHAQSLGGAGDKSQKQVSSNGTQTYQYRDSCKKCGAQRIDNQLGLEPTPQEYVDNMVEVFKEVKRVLKDDGTLWLNLGDTYSAQRWSGNGAGQPMNKMKDGYRDIAPEKQSGLPDKNLVGIPWRVALALQADGWYLRQDIIWAKPNPMPEPVRDRCTKSHEYVFLLSKQSKYYFDNEAIKEPAKWHGKVGTGQRAFVQINATRNKRSVWSITTKPFKGAHFAVMPEALVEPCILAGCPENGLVLDPFFGAGTVGLVAKRNNRRYVGIELNREYAAIAEKRITCG